MFRIWQHMVPLLSIPSLERKIVWRELDSECSGIRWTTQSSKSSMDYLELKIVVAASRLEVCCNLTLYFDHFQYPGWN
jgi:hypothetical protein